MLNRERLSRVETPDDWIRADLEGRLMPIKKIREVLDADLDNLQEALAWMLEYLHGENVLAAFTSEASALEAAAWPADQEHVRSRLQRMLCDSGLIPGVEKYGASPEPAACE